MQIHPGLKIESSKIKELDTLLGRINTADDFFKIIESLKSMEKDCVEQNSVENFNNTILSFLRVDKNV